MIDLEPAPTVAVPTTAVAPAPDHRYSVAMAAAPATGWIPMTATLPDGTQVAGQITDLTTRVVDGGLTAVGTITIPGEGTDTFIALVRSVDCNSSCTVLTLDLGRLFLDRGPAVDLAPVKLDVTAVPGSGHLLGSLVRAVFLLLGDISGAPHRLSALLNQLLFGLGL